MSNASGSTCPWKWLLQDLRPFSGRLPPCGCRALGEEAVGGLRACRSRLRKQRTGVGDQSQSERRVWDQDILTHQCPYLCRNCTEMLCLWLCWWGSPSFQQISTWSFSTTSPTQQAAAPLTFSASLLVGVTQTDLLLFGMRCTKAVKQWPRKGQTSQETH